MAPNPLTVPAGTVYELDTDRPETTAKFLAFRRPLTAVALKAIAGAAAARPLRLDDPKAFEAIEDPQRLRELVRFEADEHGRVNKMDPQVLRAMLLSLPDDGPMPQSVRLEQHARSLDQWRATARLRPQAAPQANPPGRLVRVAHVAVPDWIRLIKFYIPVLVFSDLVVEANATLVIGSKTTGLIAQNITMRQGARIVQHAPHLTVTVSGTVVGMAA